MNKKWRILPLLFLSLLLTTAARATPADSADRFEKVLSYYEALDRMYPTAPGGIVFTGSSSIHIWSSIETDFPKMGAINRGMGGSYVSDVIEHYDRLIARYQPRQVVFYSGTNDLASGKSSEQVLKDFATLFDKIHADFPRARVSFITIAPNPLRWALVNQFRYINSTIESWTATRPWLDMINVFDAMLGSDGKPMPEIFLSDQLHMNAKGYAIWKDVVAPHLLPNPKR